MYWPKLYKNERGWLYCVWERRKLSYTMHPERTMNSNEKKNTHFNSIATSKMVVISFFCHSPAVVTGYSDEFCVVWALSRLVDSISFRFSCSLVYFQHGFFLILLVPMFVSISLPDHTFCVNTIRFAHKFSFFIHFAIENNVWNASNASFCLRLTEVLSDGFIATESLIKY